MKHVWTLKEVDAGEYRSPATLLGIFADEATALMVADGRLSHEDSDDLDEQVGEWRRDRFGALVLHLSTMRYFLIQRQEVIAL